MAIVAEFKCANGARVQIADDCYRGISAEELERRWAAVGREILRIDRAVQLERLRQERAEAQPRA